MMPVGHHAVSISERGSTFSNSSEFFWSHENIRLRLAGVNPNSVAIRIIVATC